jgi:hypothetical protein
MNQPCTVVIGAAHLLEALRELVCVNGEVLSFAESDAAAALEAIATRRPQLIAIERLFAVTPRGAALINRIKAEPSLEAAEIRVLSHDGTYSRVSPRRSPTQKAAEGAATAAAGARQFDYAISRRSPRARMVDGTEVQIDGALAKVVDLSVIGAQVLSQTALRPQQRIRMTLADDLGIVKFNASVAWASFEIPARYRAGVEFKDAEATAVNAFLRRHERR